MTDKYTATTWGAKSAFVDLEVPSGQLCQVRQPGVENLIAAGVLENADTLMGLVNKKVEKAQGKKPPAKKAQAGSPAEIFQQDPKQLVSLFSMIDRVVEHMVVQPPIQRPVVRVPIEGKPGEFDERPMMPEERDAEKIYTDSIDLGDRMFIFQYAIGGGDDLDTFRREFAAGVGSLAAK